MADRALSTASMAGADQVKIDWNSRYMMAKKAPSGDECRKKLSGGSGFAPGYRPGAEAMRQLVGGAARSRTSGASSRWARGGGVARASSQAPDYGVQPLPVRADTGTPGMQGGAEFRHIERQPVAVQYVDHIGQHGDRFAVALAIANHLQGKIEVFSSRVASIRHSTCTTSGSRGALEMLHRDPSSAEIACRSRCRGKSTSTTSGRHAWADADIHGDTGKLATLWCSPVSRLNSRLLPELGLPMRMTFLAHRH